MTALPDTARLSKAEARSLTDEVKGDSERLWRKLVELYEGGAHKILGYSSWADYFKVEFGGSESRAHQILDAGRVVRALDSTIGGVALPNERVARELRPLLKQPEQLREVWAYVAQTHKEPTAADIRVAVREVSPDFKPSTLRQQQVADANRQRVYKALAGIEGFCLGLTGVDLRKVAIAATADDYLAWEQLAANAISELNRLRKSLKEARQ